MLSSLWSQTRTSSSGAKCPLPFAERDRTDFLHNSLLPAPLHVGVAKLCIKNGTSLVTASYVSPEMNGLHAEAKEADIVLLNELGLVSNPRKGENEQKLTMSLASLQDPGIDHASAMKLIEEARESGNEVGPSSLTRHELGKDLTLAQSHRSPPSSPSAAAFPAPS